jgi:putative transcriptional regulator
MVYAGDLLISPPRVSDRRFEKTVLLVAHHKDTSLAFCLNRRTNYMLSDIVKDIGIDVPQDIRLFWGGPVNSNTVWMIHDSSWVHQSTVPINEDWSYTSHYSMFNNLAERDMPKRFRIVYGCANWAPGTLEAEIEGIPPWSKNYSWLMVEKPDPDWLLECDTDKLWIDSTDLCSRKATAQWIPQ